MVFTDVQAAVLLAEWDNAAHWFFLVEIFADDVEDRDPAVAEGLRWLCRIRQRPFIGTPHCWWMPGTQMDEIVGFWEGRIDGYNNYLSDDFRTLYPTHVVRPHERVTLFVAAAIVFAGLAPERKAELWSLATTPAGRTP